MSYSKLEGFHFVLNVVQLFLLQQDHMDLVFTEN